MFGLPSLFPVGSLALPEPMGLMVRMALQELPAPKARRVLKDPKERKAKKGIRATLAPQVPL
jgi:hypothetical protein